jgi:hypothetical protein
VYCAAGVVFGERVERLLLMLFCLTGLGLCV